MSEQAAERSRGPKSVITCDLEGRIETFNDGAEQLFGWRRDEVVGRKRVSLFSPGLVVLEHVPRWLKEAVDQGEHKSRTVFLRKDGTPFAAEVRITPTFKEGRQIGYCGVTTALPEVEPAAVMPPISMGTRIFRWLVVTRAPFLTATLVPILLGAAVVGQQPGPFPWLAFGLAVLAGVALHVSANVFNDYFDWKSGTDEANTDYFLPFSGGSRAIELGLITPRGLLLIGLASVLVAVGCALALLSSAGPGLLAFGAAGALIGFFYTAPPLRLAARRGLGELAVLLAFGPLMTAGTIYAMTGQAALGDYLLGLPVGLLTTAILYINEFPDADSDARTGKNHLVVTLGKERARWGYVALMVLAFGFGVVGAALGLLPLGHAAMLLALPLVVKATRILWRHYNDRALVTANATTIQLHMAAGLLATIGVLALG